MKRHPVRDLRHIGVAEAASFLLLLGVAMPLKYLAGMPMAVRVVGMAHGLLFMLYVYATYRAARFRGWGAGRVVEVLVASLLPFGPFFLDASLKEEELESRSITPTQSGESSAK